MRPFITHRLAFLTVLAALLCISCSDYDEGDYVPIDHSGGWLSGGRQTSFDRGVDAYSHPFVGMSEKQNQVFEVGDVFFDETTFVSAPAPHNPGLGPVYNNVACSACHMNEGRGTVPPSPYARASMLFRTSLPGQDAHGGPLPVPGFGTQLQNQAISGKVPEVHITIAYQEITRHFDDGTAYTLRVPTYTVLDSYTNFPSAAMLSPRVAPPVFGLGLLQAVSEADILAQADPGDANNDGISGRPNYVWSYVNHREELGRFGLKANVPSILEQVAGALHGDIGITTSIFPVESSYGQPQYDELDDDYELSDSLLYTVSFYIKTLAVPARRNVDDPEVIRGKQLFNTLECAKCHTPTLHTKVNVAFPSISNLVIHPYTDMLLHDMGEGLADHRPDYQATGREWRTSPLWGIGLSGIANGNKTYLHDGRARTLMEAIMWHGGEAAESRDKVKALSKEDRHALLKFLKSL